MFLKLFIPTIPAPGNSSEDNTPILKFHRDSCLNSIQFDDFA